MAARVQGKHQSSRQWPRIPLGYRVLGLGLNPEPCQPTMAPPALNPVQSNLSVLLGRTFRPLIALRYSSGGVFTGCVCCRITASLTPRIGMAWTTCKPSVLRSGHGMTPTTPFERHGTSTGRIGIMTGRTKRRSTSPASLRACLYMWTVQYRSGAALALRV
jgi:hypothetical protein